MESGYGQIHFDPGNPGKDGDLKKKWSMYKAVNSKGVFVAVGDLCEAELKDQLCAAFDLIDKLEEIEESRYEKIGKAISMWRRL